MGLNTIKIYNFRICTIIKIIFLILMVITLISIVILELNKNIEYPVIQAGLTPSEIRNIIKVLTAAGWGTYITIRNDLKEKLKKMKLIIKLKPCLKKVKKKNRSRGKTSIIRKRKGWI